jgi:hypothetical protein
MKDVMTQIGDGRLSDRVCCVIFPPQQVPFRERLVDKLADLLIAAGEVLDIARGDQSGPEECPVARRAARSQLSMSPDPERVDSTEPMLSVIAWSPGQRVVSNPVTIVESVPRRETPNAFDRAIAARVAGAAETIFESVNLLMQEITD